MRCSPAQAHATIAHLHSETLATQDRPSIYIDDLASHEVGQIGSQKKNRPGNFFRSSGATEWNGGGHHFLACFRFEHGIGHIRGNPPWRNGINENVITSKLGGEAFGEADDAA